MRKKGQTLPERHRQHHAFEVFRDMGHKRSRRETAKLVGASIATVCRWAKLYKWDERIQRHGELVTERKEAGALMKAEGPVAEKLMHILEQAEALIDSAFVKDESGKLSPISLKIKDVDSLAKLIGEYRKLLEVYDKVAAPYIPAGKEKGRTTNIREFNVNVGDLPQQERINLMRSIANGNVAGGNKESEGGIQDTDYTDISGQGDEDGSGRDGVPSSPASGSGGDEEAVRKP